METPFVLLDLAEPVWSETKYRDIADGNRIYVNHFKLSGAWSETKYRDIADGNQTPLSAPPSRG